MLLPKPRTRKQVKAQKARTAAKVVKSVRQQVAERDGYCRLMQVGAWVVVGECDGPSEWAHFGDFKRFKTSKQAPEARHRLEGSLMLCRRHHDRYDGRALPKLWIKPLTSAGADGLLCAKGAGVRTFTETGRAVPSHVDVE